MAVRPSTVSPSIGSGDVDRRVRVVDQRIFGVGEVGEAVAETVDLIVDRVVTDGVDGHFDLQLVVAGEVHLRADLDDGFELDVAFFLTGGDLDLGRRDHVDVVFGHRVDVELGKRVAERLLTRDVGAHAGLEQLARRLARTEAGHPYFPRQLAKRGVDRLLEFTGRNRDVELDFVALYGLDRAVHKEEAVYRGGARLPVRPFTAS